MTIFLDFDGTMVEHAYPAMGQLNPYALAVVKRLQEKGYTIVLNTYRSNIDDSTLQDALDYLNNHPEVELGPITSTKEKFFPPPFLDKTNKVAVYKAKNGDDYFFIDDMQVGIPLIPATVAASKMVDWKTVERLLEEVGIL